MYFTGSKNFKLKKLWQNICCGKELHRRYIYFFESTIEKQPPEVFCKNKVFLEISQNSQENTCARDSVLIKFQA